MNELKAKSKVAGLCNMLQRHYPNPLTNLERARVRDHGVLANQAECFNCLRPIPGAWKR